MVQRHPNWPQMLRASVLVCSGHQSSPTGQYLGCISTHQKMCFRRPSPLNIHNISLLTTLYIIALVPVHLWLGTVHQCWHQPGYLWERGGQQPGSMQRQWGQGSRSRWRRPLHSPQCSKSPKSPHRWLWKPALRMLQYFGLIDKNIVMCIVWMLSKF